MHVENERDVNHARPGRHVREVRHPELVGAERSEVPVDEVARAGLPFAGVDGPVAAAAERADQAEVAHQSFHGAAGDVMPVAS